MDKIKQRAWDLVSYKKNIGFLQAKIQVLMEEVSGVQTLLMGENEDTEDGFPNWFAEADAIIKEANDILDGVNDMTDKKRLCSTCWDPTSSWEIGEMLRDIDRILEERQSLELSSGLSYCNRLQSRENTLQEILEALMEIQINSIGIYGMIGVGKTLLAKEIARHAQNNQLFDVIVMVQVSESVDVKHIQCQIAYKIGLQLSEADDEETKAHFLYNELQQKVTNSKILVIFDGIQCVIDLGRVGIPYGHGKSASCKVVLISRDVNLCKEMGVNKQFSVACLNLDEAKVLFQERLGDKIENMEIEPERYQYMETVFLIKCRGLPLVINSLACALRSMSWSKWETIADEIERHTLVEVDEVKKVASAILGLCNKFIQNQKKRKLFLLCCLIQQGADITFEKLLRYGIGFGLFEVDSFSSILGQTHSWVHELKSLSLLMDGKKLQHVSMHDIIQDVAISTLSQGDYILPVLLDAFTCWNSRESYENCVAISMTPNSNYKCIMGLELYKLQAFLLKASELYEPQVFFKIRRSSLSLPNNFFQGMQNLRILEISEMEIEDFPSSFGDLKNLVTLLLEYCDIRCGLKSMISNLATILEVFSLRGSEFSALPEEIGKLSKLRVLDLTDCECELDTFPVDDVVKLDQLRELYLYCRYWSWNTDDIEKLMYLPLEVLEIRISNTLRVSPNVMDCKHPYVLPIQLALKCRVVEVSNCESVAYIFPRSENKETDGAYSIVELPCLEKLVLKGVKSLLTLQDVLELPNLSSPQHLLFNEKINLPSLKELHLEGLDQIVNLWDTQLVDLQSGMYSRTPCFGNLRYMTIARCSKLKSLFPPSTVVSLLHLEKLQVFACESMEEVITSKPIEDEANPTTLLIFPKLETLELRWLRRLQCFCRGHLLLKLPMLRELELEALWEMEAFIHPNTQSLQIEGPTILFDEKTNLPSLKKLHVKGLHQIVNLWDARLLDLQSEMYSKTPCFGNLKCMTISQCSNLKSLFPASTVFSLLHLEKLQVLRCENMEEVITCTHDEDYTNVITFPELQTLELKDLPRLQCFYLGRLLLKFPNAESLQKEGATILFNGEIEFPLLEQLSLDRLKIELIQRHDETTIFPNLLSLQLSRLPYLKALPNMNSKTLRLLDLERIKRVALFRIFEQAHATCMPVIISLELEELRLSHFGWVEDLFGNENSVDVKLFFSLKKLELNHLGVNSIPWKRLINLRSLTICGSLRRRTNLISSSLLLGGDVLPLLESLKVRECRSLESIVSQEQVDDGDVVKYGMTIFPSLRSIHLVQLWNLKSFCMGSYKTHFPSLETLEISGCHSLQSFSSGRLRTPRLKSVKINGETLREANTVDDLNAMLPALCQAAAEAERATAEAATIDALEAGVYRSVIETIGWPKKSSSNLQASEDLEEKGSRTDKAGGFTSEIEDLGGPPFAK